MFLKIKFKIIDTLNTNTLNQKTLINLKFYEFILFFKVSLFNSTLNNEVSIGYIFYLILSP